MTNSLALSTSGAGNGGDFSEPSSYSQSEVFNGTGTRRITPKVRQTP